MSWLSLLNTFNTQSSSACVKHNNGIEILLTTLEQVYSWQARVQFAFKNLMTHLVLRFALIIAFRRVLHRCESQEIHR